MINRKILFVDDDQMIFDLLKRKLTGYKYEMFFAENGEEALDILAKHEIAVLVSDLRMPVMNGIILLERAQKVSPNTMRLVMSSMKDSNTIFAAIRKGQIFRYISKPILYDSEMIPAINDAIAEYESLTNKNELINKLASIKQELTEKTEKISKLENKEKAEKEIILNLLKKYTLEVDKHADMTFEYIEKSISNDYQKGKITAETEKVKSFTKAILNFIHLK